MAKTPGEGRRKLTPGDRLLAKSKPKTGDGWVGGQKPNLADTNLGTSGRKSLLRIPAWLIGRHRK